MAQTEEFQIIQSDLSVEESISLRKKLFDEYIEKNPVEPIKSSKDVPEVRLRNVEEKVKVMLEDVHKFCETEGEIVDKKGGDYGRLSEACYRLQIQLDSIKVRKDLKPRKTKLLKDINNTFVKLDQRIQQK